MYNIHFEKKLPQLPLPIEYSALFKHTFFGFCCNGRVPRQVGSICCYPILPSTLVKEVPEWDDSSLDSFYARLEQIMTYNYLILRQERVSTLKLTLLNANLNYTNSCFTYFVVVFKNAARKMKVKYRNTFHSITIQSLLTKEDGA